MPREGAAADLREEILGRLEQVSVVLLPVFCGSGLSVDLSSVGLSGLVELCLILVVAIAGGSAAPSSAPASRGSVADARPFPGTSPSRLADFGHDARYSSAGVAAVL
jgi:hypothetical protein